MLSASTETTHCYHFQVLRYVPNLVSGEYFNIGLLLYDSESRLIDARFTAEFRRLRCHPLAELDYLEALRNEFEEKRLLGEGFSEYVRGLGEHLSAGLEMTDSRVFWGGAAETEIERLRQSFLVTPSRREIHGDDSEALPGTRRALRRQMEQTFQRYHLIGAGLDSRVSAAYAGPRLRFTFDYSYQPNGAVHYIHALALRNDVSDASKLCFVFERLRAQAGESPELTAVLDDSFPDDTRELLESSTIVTRPASQLNELAFSIRGELGM